MKKLFFGAFLLLLFPSLYAQNPALKPFYHGVASGDALADKVIIWTRVTPDSAATLVVDWAMATDTLFTNIVKSGTTTTDSSRDYTVKVDVTGLEEDTWYYYAFKHNGYQSLIGRTKTLPTGDNSRIRLAVVSCSSIGSGNYFNAYSSIAKRNDIHAVVHLGDYIYEYAGGGVTGKGIPILPNTETTTLAKYRERYNTYRLDPDLMRLHQQYPFYTVWDDHETANNSWEGGSNNHTPGAEGDWLERREWGKQANFEWLPKREIAPGDYTNYGAYNFGDLADLIMLDTRLEGRSEQASTTNTAAHTDTNRTILGTTQMQWFKNQLSSSTARWKIIGQQVMIAPVRVFGVIVNADQWDGYQADRNRVINHVLDNDIENIVFLTGDIHSSWASDIPGPGYNASTGAGSAFVEYVCSSVTSDGSPVALDPKPFNPHIKYADLTQRGYLILDLDEDRAQADWVYVSTITSDVFTESLSASWQVNEGERFLRQSSGPAAPLANPAYFAPLNPVSYTVGVTEASAANGITVYPNPFENSIFIAFHLPVERNVVVRLHNVLGKLVSETTAPSSGTLTMNLPDLQKGAYILSVSTGKEEFKSTIVKMQ